MSRVVAGLLSTIHKCEKGIRLWRCIPMCDMHAELKVGTVPNHPVCQHKTSVTVKEIDSFSQSCCLLEGGKLLCDFLRSQRLGELVIR